MSTKQLHITEHKSHGALRPFVSNSVRVFVDQDYHYGYFVDEVLLVGLLSEEQQRQYLEAPGDIQLDVPIDVARMVVENGQTPYTKQVF